MNILIYSFLYVINKYNIYVLLNNEKNKYSYPLYQYYDIK